MSISTSSAPRSFRIFTPARQAALAAASPKNFWSAGRGMPMTQRGGTAPRRPSAIGAREGIVLVLAGDHLVHGPGVVDGAGKDRDAVERAAGRHHALGRHRSHRRLEADDVVQARRHAARARRVGAERERHQAQRHGDGRARARSARHDGGIEGVPRHRIGRAHADEAGGELVEVGLADQQRAGGERALDRGGAGLGRVGEGRAGGRRRQAGGVDVVLDGEGDAPQRLGFGSKRPSFCAALRTALAVGERDEDAGIARLLDRLEHAIDDLDGIEPARVGVVQSPDVDGDIGLMDRSGASGPAGRIDDADVRGDHAPAVREAHPGLHLAAHLLAAPCRRDGTAWRRRRSRGRRW